MCEIFINFYKILESLCKISDGLIHDNIFKITKEIRGKGRVGANTTQDCKTQGSKFLDFEINK